jgi:hypothetical protein
MYLANVPAVEVSETETAETATPPIVDDNALIKESYIPASPRKEG